MQAAMGAKQSKSAANKAAADEQFQFGVGTTRGQAITGKDGGKNAGPKARPAYARPVEQADYEFVVHALSKLLLFSKQDESLVSKVVMGMWERDCEPGTRLPHLQPLQLSCHRGSTHASATARPPAARLPNLQPLQLPCRRGSTHAHAPMQARS